MTSSGRRNAKLGGLQSKSGDYRFTFGANDIHVLHTDEDRKSLFGDARLELLFSRTTEMALETHACHVN